MHARYLYRTLMVLVALALSGQPAKFTRTPSAIATLAGALTCTCAPTVRSTVQGVVQSAPSTRSASPEGVLASRICATGPYAAVIRKSAGGSATVTCCVGCAPFDQD